MSLEFFEVEIVVWDSINYIYGRSKALSKLGYKKKRVYIKTSNGYKPIKSEYICALGYVEQKIFIDKNKPFYFKPFDDAPELTFNRFQKTFRFLNKDKNRVFISSEESATHKYCIQEIAKLNKLTLIINGKPITLIYHYCFEEIVLKIGEKFIIPDLLLFIREPYDLALKWNRLVAIEVVVSHDLDGNKLEIMRDAKIPLIRIKANKKWGRKKEYEMNNTQKEKLRTWIKNTFKNEYSADLILNPKSKTILENKTIQILENKNLNLKESYKKSLEAINKYSDENKKINNSLVNLNSKNEKALSLIKDGEKKIEEANLIIKNQEKTKNIYFRLVMVLFIIVSIESAIIYIF